MVDEQTATLNRLAEAFNEGDRTLRRSLLEGCWGPSSRLVVNGATAVTGVDALDQLIAQNREDPEYWVKLSSVKRGGDHEWARWTVYDVQRPPRAQDLVADRADDGRLKEVRATDAVASRHGQGPLARIQEAAVANPVPALGVLGGTLYLALRIPVGLFYNDLGVTPDEVGVGPQVLVPQSLTLIAVFVLAMVGIWALSALFAPAARAVFILGRLQRRGERRRAWIVAGALAIAAILAYALTIYVASKDWLDAVPGLLNTALLLLPALVVMSLAGAVGGRVAWMVKDLDELKDKQRRRRGRREQMKAFAWLCAIYGAFGLLIVLPIWSLIDADAVRSGHSAMGRLSPWRAQPAELQWNKPLHVQLNNSCRYLRLLGVANGQMLVFDTHMDKAFRIPVADASASVAADCPKSG